MRRWLLVVVLALLATPATAKRGWLFYNLTVADLPASCSPSRPFWITDGATSTDCSTGSGASVVTCICDAGGSSYTGQAPSGSDGVGVDEIMEEGSGLTKRAQVNFIGASVTCADNAGNTRTDCTLTDADTQLTQEQVEDYAGGMVTGNTETGIAVTYQDADGTVDFVAEVTQTEFDAQTHVEADITDLDHLSEAEARTGLIENGSAEMTVETLGTACTDGQLFEANATGGADCVSAGGDVSGAADALVVGDDSHAHTTTTISGLVEADITDLSHTADTTLSQEEVEDYAGALVGDGTGTHTGIAVTYQDATGDVDIVVDHDAATNYAATEHVNWAGDSAGTIHATNYVDDDVPDAGEVDDTALAAGAVDGGLAGEIADGTVDANDLATDSVSADELNATGVEAELEAVLDLNELQGAVTDAQVPDTITASSYLPLAGGTLTGALAVDGDITSTNGVLRLTEQADADADVATEGQIWVNTATPNELWFTNDAGTDTQLGVGGSETNDLESVAASAGDAEVFVGTGVDAGAYIAGLAACAADEKIEYTAGSPDTFSCEAIGSLVEADVGDLDHLTEAEARTGLIENGSAEMTGETLGTACTNGQILKANGTGGLDCGADSTGGSPSFDTIATGTNTTAAMTVGTGGSLLVSGSGTIAATTAAALAANGSNCAAGEIALGVDDAGAVEGCYQPAEADITDLDHLTEAEARTGLIENGSAEMTGETLGTACTNGQILKANGTGGLDCGADSTGGSPSFDTIATGTNTTAAMTVGTGGSLLVSGSGTIAATTAAALAANGSNCAAGEIPLGVDDAGAVEGCYQPAEADITDLAHTATAITDGLIIEADLNEDSGTPTDEDVLTYDSTGTNFNWAAQSTLAAGTAAALAANGADCTAGSYPLGVDAAGAAASCTDASTEIDSIVATHTSDATAHHTATVEVNDLEGTAPAAILTTEIMVGTGAGTATLVALSGDATMSNGGVVTVADESHAHTTTTISGLVEADVGDLDHLTEAEARTGLIENGSAEMTLETMGTACTVGQVVASDGAGGMDCAAAGGTPATADISDVSVTQTELAELETIDATTISAAQWTGLGGATTAGIALWDDANAAAQRTTLGVDAAGTDNSTDVTLAGTPDYITISGQVITRTVLDTSDDTNLAVTAPIVLTDDTVSIDQTSAFTWTGDHDFSGGGIEIENGITPPACTEGQLYLDTDATAGQQLMACDAGTFVLQGDGGGAEANDLEGAAPASVLTTEVFIGTGAGTGAFAALSGDATMANDGTVTVVDDQHAHVITNIDAFNVAALQTQTSDVTTFYTEDTVVPVVDGGTGASTFTDGGILLGSGTGAISALGAASNGQIPIGDGTTDPVLATIAAEGGGEITVTNGAGTITLDVGANTISAAELSDSLDLGGDTSFEIPNGAGNTVNADGEIAHDTTADQLIVGADPTVFHPGDCKSAVIENLAAADDDFEIGMFNFAVTITDIGLHCAGTCSTGADISLEDRSGNAMTHTVPTHSTTTGNTTFQSVTAANGLVSGEALRFDVDNAVSPETDTYTITYCYTVDRQ